MNFDDFSPENIDLRAIKVEEAHNAFANAYFAQFETEDFTESDVDFFDNAKVEWFDEKSDILNGKTPREYIAENWGEKPDFEAAVTLVKPFFFDDNYDVPKELADLIRSFPEFTAWAADFIEMLKMPCDEERFLLSSGVFFTLISTISDDTLIKKALELYDVLDYEKFEFACDAVAAYLASTEKGTLAIAEKTETAEPDGKTFTLLANASTGTFRSDEIYKAIRSFCKKATPDFLPGCFYLFSDYADQRAVSFLRTQAKKYRDLWYSAVDAEKNRDIYLTIVEIIRELGGNTEDFD